MFKSFQKFTFIAASLLLTACAGAVLDTKTKLEDVKSAGEGIAVLTAAWGFQGCATTNMTFGREDAEKGGLVSGEHHILKTQFTEKSLPLQLKLKAGEYKIVSFGCISGNRTTTVLAPGRLEGSFLARYRVFSRPIATFTVNAGEVVDIGAFEIAGFAGTASVTVGSLTEANKTTFAELYPKLYEAMITRHAVKIGAAPADVKKLEDMLALIDKQICDGWKKKTPEEQTKASAATKKRCNLKA